jgi:hypothetical protein
LQKKKPKPLKSLRRAQNCTSAPRLQRQSAECRQTWQFQNAAPRAALKSLPLTRCHPTVLEEFYLAGAIIDIATPAGSKSLTIAVRQVAWSLGCAPRIVQSFAAAGARSGTPSLWRWPASQAPPSLTRSLHQTLGRLHLSRLRPPPGPSLRTLRACPTPLPSPCHS